MQNNTILSTGSALMGAGIALVLTSTNTGLELIGIGALLTIIVAYLQSKGLNVQTPIQG